MLRRGARRPLLQLAAGGEDAAGRRWLAGAAESSRGGTDFWAATPLEDLPDSSVEQELLRRHNSTHPYLQGHAIVGRIVGVDRDHVTISTGLRSLSSFAKKELHLSQLVRSRDAGVREGPRDFRLGDVMHFVLEQLETPFGDVGLRVVKPTEEEKAGLLWEELQELFEAQQPVMGRILNPVGKGYAVGVAGLTAFLPFRLCSLLAASKVGVLQPFRIQVLARSKGFVSLADPAVLSQEEARRAQLAARLAAARPRPDGPSSSASGRPGGGVASEERALSHPQLVQLKNRINRWRTEPSAGDDIRPFPAAMKVCLELSRKHNAFFLNRQQLDFLITSLQQQLPADICEALLGLMRRWGVDTTPRTSSSGSGSRSGSSSSSSGDAGSREAAKQPADGSSPA